MGKTIRAFTLLFQGPFVKSKPVGTALKGLRN